MLAALLVALVLAGCNGQATGPLAVDPGPTIQAEAASSVASLTRSPEPTAAITPEPTTEPAPVLTQPTNPVVVSLPGAAGPSVSAFRIQIQRLGISLPVLEGDVARDVDRAQTPEHYAFHLPGTSWFDVGNTYIYAHARVGMFLSLWNARVGDVVIVQTPKTTLEYVVAEIHPRVPPTEISWAQQTRDTRLTLQTSTGPNGSDPRFVVVARPK